MVSMDLWPWHLRAGRLGNSPGPRPLPSRKTQGDSGLG